MTKTDKAFIEKCNAKVLAGDLIRCLSAQQVQLCTFALPFGEGHLCKHPRRKEIAANTKPLPNLQPPAEI
jgi:hypothetical protein